MEDLKFSTKKRAMQQPGYFN